MEDKLILLVEDNPHIMAINDAALHMRGYRTLQAETAHKCRELLCFHAVDLIVLDILLPDGDGVALCREIKQEYDVPILFLTAMGENEDIVITDGDVSGCVAFVSEKEDEKADEVLLKLCQSAAQFLSKRIAV